MSGKMRFANVVVFGDSLSDIGIKDQTVLGRVVKALGAMTTNPGGRFSDCRNWCDHMFEAATGRSLMAGDAAAVRATSKAHQSFGAASATGGGDSFRYANYAEGGACGATPHSALLRIALGTMKEQVKSFRRDWAAHKAGPGERTLFLVWFGANDLYTAGSPANLMAGVATEVASAQRNELAALVGPQNARFVFVDMGLPLSATRYQKVFDQARVDREAAFADLKAAQLKAQAAGAPKAAGKELEKAAKQAERERKAEYELRRMLNNFESGVLLYNHTLRETAARNGDAFVEMSSVLSRESVTALLEGLRLIPGSQAEGTSKRHVTAADYERTQELVHVTSSDDAHPTDRIYKTMWDRIAATLGERQFGFGRLAG
jgi:phospholipase/lecithinase/hemolysin